MSTVGDLSQVSKLKNFKIKWKHYIWNMNQKQMIVNIYSEVLEIRENVQQKVVTEEE